MPHTRIVGLQVDDPDLYQKYRAAMEPILIRYGGRFRYDFWIRETLRNEDGKNINRVFVIEFPDPSSRDKFFSDPDYLEIRKRYFDSSVSATTVIAEFTGE
jgi:uncharacterized protein (DUF1330 family)